MDEDELFLSALTLGELHKGVAKLADGPRAQRLREWLERDVVSRFEGRILPVDIAVARRWGKLAGESMARGFSLPIIDALLAATALQHSALVVTRNLGDFARCGVETVNPWDSSPA